MTENVHESLKVKIGLLLMSIDLRLKVLITVADEAREDNDQRWYRLIPQIQELRKDKWTCEQFLEDFRLFDMNDLPEIIASVVEEPLYDSADTFSDISSIEAPQSQTIQCKAGTLGVKTHGRRRHHRI